MDEQNTQNTQKVITNPVKAIRAKCLDCSYTPNEVAMCTIIDCPLHPFRFGKNPYRTKREMSDEQKAAARERFAKARAAIEAKHAEAQNH